VGGWFFVLLGVCVFCGCEGGGVFVFFGEQDGGRSGRGWWYLLGGRRVMHRILMVWWFCCMGVLWVCFFPHPPYRAK